MHINVLIRETFMITNIASERFLLMRSNHMACESRCFRNSKVTTNSLISPGICAVIFM